ncbi:hypothetical protein H1R20_g15912, partial [Candolleomyces eurysporus]
MFTTEVQFGHAGSMANSDLETADAKNRVMRDAGFVVPGTCESLVQADALFPRRLSPRSSNRPRPANVVKNSLVLSLCWFKWLFLLATKFVKMALTSDPYPLSSISHKIKSFNSPGLHVKLVMEYMPGHSLLNYALTIKKVACFVNLLWDSGAFNPVEVEEYTMIGTLNGLFILERSIWFIGFVPLSMDQHGA